MAAACMMYLAITPLPTYANPHTYVSITGDDTGTGQCGYSSPCRTIQYTLGWTNSGGVITLLDEADFAITQPGSHVTIEGQGSGTRLLNANAIGVNYVYQSGRLVLRNLSIGSDFTAFGLVGIDFNGASLRLENVTITNQIGGTGIGVYFRPTGDGILEMENVAVENSGSNSASAAVTIETAANKTNRVSILDSNFGYVQNGIIVKGSGNAQLSISNTTIAHAINNGIFVNPSGGTHKIDINDSQIVNNGATGVYVAPTGSAKVDVTINASSLANNSNIGIAALPGGSSSIAVSIADTSVSGNAWGGIYASGKSNFGIIRANIASNGYGITAASPATVRVGGSMINGNYLGVSGPINSYGNNQLLGNTTQGSATTVPPAGKP